MAYNEIKGGGKRRTQVRLHTGSAADEARQGKKPGAQMWRLIKFLLLLAVIAVLGLLGYSYSGYLQPVQTEITQPVELDVD
jgi:hypothetical protein